MLLSFGARNFFCFKDWVEISLALNSKVPKEVSKGNCAALSLCLKGGNASGKTNALKILSFLSFFCTDSFNQKPDAPILFETFFNNDSISEFYVTFEIDKITYTYELATSKETVISEKIYKKDKRNSLVFHRNKNIIKINKVSKTNVNVSIRSNASVISIYKQFEIAEFNVFYDFFHKIISNVTYSGFDNRKTHEETSELYFKNKEILEFTLENLKKFDTGISDIKMDKYTGKDNKEHYYPLFIHNLVEQNNPELPFKSQSSGTQALYSFLAIYNITLKGGGILILDEFDIMLHPDILPHLVELFENIETNPKKAQLIFSTHNCEILDVMGKYKTYLFNKEEGECFCYRLDEFKDNIIRNDRPIMPLYISGKIGGIPKI